MLAAVGCLILAGCSRAPERRFDLKGKVVAVDPEHRQVTVAHEAISGFMDAMTMPFNVREDWAMAALQPGQEIEATLVVRGEQSWIEKLRITKIKEMRGAAPAGAGPQIGAAVPDFTLVNQNGRRIHLAQYRGRPLLLTFIYTRCPIPDFCPRTSRNFAEIFREIRTMPVSDKKPHLLTISFDPQHDTPEVLQQYGRRYMNPPAFHAWEFATGSAAEIKAITGYFGLSYWEASGQIVHALVTVLIDLDGKVARLYLGKDWTPAQILAEFR